mgnify:CR=1 FL=1
MTKSSARTVLAQMGMAPIGLSREEAAAYIGVSDRKFDAMVDDGRMPSPKVVDGRRIWSRTALDKAFAALPDEKGQVESNDVWANVRA